MYDVYEWTGMSTRSLLDVTKYRYILLEDIGSGMLIEYIILVFAANTPYLEVDSPIYHMGTRWMGVNISTPEI